MSSCRHCARPSRGLWLVLLAALLAAMLAAVSTANGQSSPPAGPAAPPLFEVSVTGHGAPMLLVPGLMSHGEVWDDVVAHYRDRRELHVLTLAGFAGVPPVDSAAAPRFLEAQRDAIIRYVRERGLERPVLVGHSLGAVLALAVAAEAPDLVGAVVAVDGVPYLMSLADSTMTPERARPNAALVAATFGTMTPAQLEAQARLAMATGTRDGARAERAVAWGRDSHAPTVARAVADLMTTDLRDAVAAIRAPVLLVGAGADRQDGALESVRATYARQVARVPDVRVVVAARARHFVMWDDLPFLLATMDDFLADAALAGAAPAAGGVR